MGSPGRVKGLRLSSFDYTLPKELIAQEPARSREQARLMVVRCDTDRVRHRWFADIPSLFQPGDCLVLNDTRVVPAKLHAVKESGGRVEILLLEPVSRNPQLLPSDGGSGQLWGWQVLIRPQRRLRQGTVLRIEGGKGDLLGTLGERTSRGRLLWFRGERLPEQLREVGSLPLPPYIRRQPEEPERYQTVYAKWEGSLAAPTAGLHFSHDVLRRLRERGVQLAFLTLHVGLGTFRPIRSERVREHEMDAEWYRIPRATAEAIHETRRRGRRVVAVGTTVTRALETSAAEHGSVVAGEGWTRLFITPGHAFQVVDMLLTNFHLPRSTPLLLAAAFCGWPRLRAAYREAIRTRYRFFSFGDAMLLSGGETDVGDPF